MHLLQKTAKRNIVPHPAKLYNILDTTKAKWNIFLMNLVLAAKKALEIRKKK